MELEHTDLRHHGDAELAPGLLDLAVNVTALAPPQWLSTAIMSACARLDSYPDARAATLAVAARHHRAPTEVLLTAGAAEAFTLIAHGLPRGRAVIVHPQFTEPEVALVAAGWEVERMVLNESDDFALDLARVPDDCTVVVIGNPTNPTGKLHSRALLRQLRRPGRTLVVDEAFMDSVPDESESLAADPDLDGVVIVRSLTKTWGLAGLRVGYLLGNAVSIEAISRVQPPWSVSTPALAAALACSGPAAIAEAEDRAIAVSAELERLRAALQDRGFVLAHRSSGPFLLVRHPERPTLHADLRDNGIAVRRADTFPGLHPGWVRVTVRDRPSSEALLATLDRTHSKAAASPGRKGAVTLVGGGPGPDHQITVQGLLALHRADVIVTDRLAPLGLLTHLRPGVTVIDAAKNPKGKAMPQDTINALLIEHAAAGRDVVRFKGGDPFVFGRGFEEQQACAAAGTRTHVVPGLSSAIAAPAMAGVPVTHRGMTHGFTVVSGHLAPGHPDSLVDWASLARSGMTLVVLMGVAHLTAISEILLGAGMAPHTPAVVVSDAGAASQLRMRTTLNRLASDAAAAKVTPPAVAVIGDVAALAIHEVGAG